MEFSRLLLLLFAALSVAEEAIDPAASVPVAASDIADAEEFIRTGALAREDEEDTPEPAEPPSVAEALEAALTAAEPPSDAAELEAAPTAAEVESARRALAREDEDEDEDEVIAA